MATPQFITDNKGKKLSVVLPINDYRKIVEELEELEDIKAYDKAMAQKKTFMPLDKAIKEIEKANKKEKVMYQVVIEKQAQKQLAKIPPPYFHNIVEALQNLATNPRPIGYKKLKGREGYRIRVADYRIIYNIQDKVLTVYVLIIAHRKEVYE